MKRIFSFCLAPVAYLLAAGVFWLLGSVQPLQAQHFKSYYRYGGFHVPALFTVKDLAPAPNREWLIAGELKDPAPTHRARAYVMRVDAAGQVLRTHSIYTHFGNTTNEVQVEAVLMDKSGMTYLAGTSVQFPQAPVPSSGSERTITALSADGKVAWSGMQGNHTFAGIALDEDEGTLLALSGPDHGNPAASLMFTQIDTDGQFVQAFTLLTPTEDRPVKLLALPAGMGYVALGVQDIEDARRPFLIRLDPALELMWQATYTDGGSPMEVTDISYHPDGYHVVSGSLLRDAPLPFVLGINEEDGQVRFMYTFDLGEGISARANSVAAFRSVLDPDLEGMLVAGEWQLKDDENSRRAFGLLVDSEGHTRWARNYSPLPPADVEQDERLMVIRHEALSDDFVAAGSLVESLGKEPYRQWAFVLRGGVENGTVEVDNTNCDAPMSVAVVPGDMLALPAETIREAGGSLFGFGYLAEEVSLHGSYCAYGEGKALAEEIEPKDEDSKPDFGPQFITIPFAPAASLGHARVFDLSGRELRSLALAPGSSYARLPLAGISRGMYILHVQDGLGKTATHKFRIE